MPAPRLRFVALLVIFLLRGWGMTITPAAAEAQAGVAFAGAGGSYGGIVNTIDNDPLNAGVVDLNLLDTGSFSGSVYFQGTKYALIGRFDPVLATFTRTFPVPGAPTFSITVSAVLDPGARTITGTLVLEQFGFPLLSANFTLSGALPDPTLGPLLADSTRTAFIDPPPAGAAQEIPGDGFAVIRVGKSKSRAARFVGRLPDFALFSSSSPLRGVKYVVFSPLYKKKKSSGGQTAGQAGVAANGSEPPSLGSELAWGKKAGADPDYYPDGIDQTVAINAQPYPTVDRGGVVPIGVESRAGNATIRFKRGNLIMPIEDTLTILPGRVRVLGSNPHQIKVKINAQKGLYQGTFVHPDSGELTSFKGAFRAATGIGPAFTPGEGRGSFVGTVDSNNAAQPGPPESGSVRIAVNAAP